MDEAHNLVLPLSWPERTPFGGAPILGSQAAQDATLAHAMQHLQEGDFVGSEGSRLVGWDNASFWFRQAGEHPLYPRVLQEASAAAEGQPEAQAHVTSHGGRWSAEAFLRLCQQAASRGDTELLGFCAKVMNIEWRLLLELSLAKMQQQLPA